MAEELTKLTPGIQAVLEQTTRLVRRSGLRERYHRTLEANGRYDGNMDEVTEYIASDAPYVFFGRETETYDSEGAGQLILSLGKATIDGGYILSRSDSPHTVDIGGIRLVENPTGFGDRLCGSFTRGDVFLGVARLKAEWQAGLNGKGILQDRTALGFRVLTLWPNRDQE